MTRQSLKDALLEDARKLPRSNFAETQLDGRIDGSANRTVMEASNFSRNDAEYVMRLLDLP
jgi:hypothetical protein